MKLVLMTDMIQNFVDTANILAGLDLLISVDTATLHLAGAIGLPAWLLLPFNNDWRWKAEGESTIWYDSVRIFRQEQLDDWQGVFDKVYKEINARLLSNK
jgi:ADP-heptose:LPS heptosyltransferase